MERDRFQCLWLKRIVAFLVSWRRPLLLSCSVLLFFLLPLLLAVWWQFWVIPHQKLATERITPAWKRELTQKEMYELQNNIRQTFIQALGGVAQALGGAALLFGLYFTAQTLRISQEGQITERFNQAIEHLGDTEPLMVRLGGIYALERIARDSKKDHWPVMEVLTAYVRVNAPWPPKEVSSFPDNQAKGTSTGGQALDSSSPGMPAAASSTSEGLVPIQIRTDIQACLTVLGRRTFSSRREERGRLDLCNTNLRSANLIGAHLEDAYLIGAHLEGAHLHYAHLEEANLIDAHLEDANLSYAHLERATLIDAHLERATLHGAHLERATLHGVHLEDATLIDAHLEEANLGDAHLERAYLVDAHLKGADLTVEQLVTVRSLCDADLDPHLKEEIQRIAPSLLQLS